MEENKQELIENDEVVEANSSNGRVYVSKTSSAAVTSNSTGSTLGETHYYVSCTSGVISFRVQAYDSTKLKYVNMPCSGTLSAGQTTLNPASCNPHSHNLFRLSLGGTGIGGGWIEGVN